MGRDEPPPDSFRMQRSETKATASAADTPKISPQHSFQLRLLSVFGICTTCTRTLSNDFDGPAMFISALKSSPSGANFSGSPVMRNVRVKLRFSSVLLWLSHICSNFLRNSCAMLCEAEEVTEMPWLKSSSSRCPGNSLGCAEHVPLDCLSAPPPAICHRRLSPCQTLGAANPSLPRSL